MRRNRSRGAWLAERIDDLRRVCASTNDLAEWEIADAELMRLLDEENAAGAEERGRFIDREPWFHYEEAAR